MMHCVWFVPYCTLFFAAGSVWRRRPENSLGPAFPSTAAGWVGIIGTKFVIGHAISQFSVWAMSFVSQLLVECCLRLYVKSFKPAMARRKLRATSSAGKAGGAGGAGEVDADKDKVAAQAEVVYGTVHMRLIAITFVELAQDITGALVTAHGRGLHSSIFQLNLSRF
jgi:hypothetical protein